MSYVANRVGGVILRGASETEGYLAAVSKREPVARLRMSSLLIIRLLTGRKYRACELRCQWRKRKNLKEFAGIGAVMLLTLNSTVCLLLGYTG